MLKRVIPAAMALALVLGAALGIQAASGQGVAKIEDFHGHFVGQGIAKDRESVVFDHAVRIMDTTIGPAPDGGFTVKWQTVTRDSEGKSARRAVQELVFKPSARKGIYTATGNSDPVGGGAYSWAEIEGRTLLVHVFTVQPDGAGNWAVYERKLTADGLDLTFRRIEATGTARIVHGKLKKQKPS